jgi:MFS family permease
MTSLLNLGSCISAIAAGIFGAYFGRKKALWLACLICLGAVSLQIGSTSKAGLYMGRLFLGFANGFFVVFSTVYCSEAAPTHLREYVSRCPALDILTDAGSWSDCSPFT